MCIAVQARRNHAPYSNKRGRPSGLLSKEEQCVQHSYQDHSHDLPPSPSDLAAMQQAAASHCGGAAPFPIKLHEMLDRVEADGVSHIVSWQPHGRCFVIHQPTPFKESLLHRYFPSISKIASFQRQLNLYGFQRITRGLDKGAYYHPLFLRGMSFLTNRIQRIKVKGTGVRQKSNPDQEPNFYAMEFVNGGNYTKDESSSSSSSEASTPLNNNYPPPSLVASRPSSSQGFVPQSTASMPRRISNSSLESYTSVTAPVEEEERPGDCLHEWGMPFYALDSLEDEQTNDESSPTTAVPPLDAVECELAMDSVLHSLLEHHYSSDLLDGPLSELLDSQWESV